MNFNNTKPELSEEEDVLIDDTEMFDYYANRTVNEPSLDNIEDLYSQIHFPKEETVEYVYDEADEVFDRNERQRTYGSKIRLVILLLSASVFCYSAFMLTSIFFEYRRDANTNNKIDARIVDSDTSVTVSMPDGNTAVIPFKYDHAAMLAINQDSLGYIYIPSINKRLPVVKTTDNVYYLRHALDHTFSMSGCVFADCRIDGKLENSHVILHGHNRKDGTIFSMLGNYMEESFYRKSGNDVFYIYTENKLMQYKIFSAYISAPVSSTYSFNFENLDELREYAADMKAQSNYDTGVSIDDATQVITLSACTDDTKNRIIVHGVLVNTGIITNE